MALPNSGYGLAITNAGNGKVTVTWSNGNPVFDDSEGELVMSLLNEPAGWYGDKLKRRRTLLPTVKTKDSSTKGTLEQYSRDALQIAIDTGRLKSVSPQAYPAGLGYQIVVSYVTSANKQSVVTVPLID